MAWERRGATWQPLGLSASAAIGMSLALAVGVTGYEFWREALVAGLLYSVVGGVLARRRPEEPVGWLLAAIGTVAAFQLLTGAWASSHLDRSLAAPTIGSVSTVLQTAAVVGVVQLVLRFPSGHPSGRSGAVTSWALLVGGTAMAVGGWFAPARLEDFAGVENPYGPAGWAATVEAVGGSVVGVAALAALVGLVLRMRRAEGRERRQLSWFVFAAVTVAVVLLVGDTVGIGDLAWIVGPASIAGGVAAGVLLYGLYDLRVVVARTIAYASVIVVLLGLHVAVVVLLRDVLGAGDVGATALATAAVAVALAPLFWFLGGRVERRIYGSRGTPYRLGATVHRTLQEVSDPVTALDEIGREIAAGLRLPFVAIEVGEEPATDGGRDEVFTIRYEGRSVGTLRTAPRSGEDHLGPRDRDALDAIAGQLGAAVRAVALTESLHASRARLVMAREEERRRIRRDLHDGLGPMLAGLSLKLEVAQNRVRVDNPAVAEMLGSQITETTAAIDAVRRMVRDLRPPAVDDLGLVGALREQALRLGSSSPVRIHIEAPDDLPTLPAATETAAFHIASEAMTNAIRHSSGTFCRVAVSVDDALHVVVEDDGAGLAEDRGTGIGLASMRERAAEVGGSCSVRSRPAGGVAVDADLPRRLEP